MITLLSRRQLLHGSAVLGLGAPLLDRASAPARAREPATADDRPDLVLVVADDLGYGALGPYGQEKIKTPVLDRMARQGLRFTQAYAAAPVCAPSRCSLYTGLHAGHARVRQNPRPGLPNGLREQDTTFAEALRAAGYRTGLFGKWGLGPERAGQPSHPNARGFGEFFGYIGHRHAHDYYPGHLWHDGKRVRLKDGRHGGYAPDLLRDRAVSFIKESGERPFLLVYTPNLPHSPSDVPSLGRYRSRSWPRADRGHAAQITRLDSHLGDLLDALPRKRKTIVLVTGDNGPHEEGGVDPDRFDANGRLRGYKRNLYEGGIRVPLIAWGPGLVKRGRSSRVTQHTDLFPTLAEFAGAPVPPYLDGTSLRGTLTGERGQGPARHLYWYRSETHSTPKANAAENGSVTRMAEAVRQDGWKLVRFAPGPDRPRSDSGWRTELYDLDKDPGERRNLASRHPEVVIRLSRLASASWAG
ncbi:arylsulfatase [Actinocorallia populi]|uniref:arylsulfatase n=1 Tax=Actinocorallia populi TaxID=2079200 RepID=UPI0018E59CE8|nr:arylsulfatase [Actinocorallia populi]